MFIIKMLKKSRILIIFSQIEYNDGFLDLSQYNV